MIRFVVSVVAVCAKKQFRDMCGERQKWKLGIAPAVCNSQGCDNCGAPPERMAAQMIRIRKHE
jgi:hypothetical protein